MKRDEEEKDLQIYQEKTLLQTRLGDFISAKVQNRRTGRESEFYRLDFADWVNVVALTKNKKIITIKQFRFGTERTEIEIPGGAIENGEDPLAAGQRELLEETGFSGKNGRVIGRVCPNPAIQSNWCYTVFIEDVTRVAEQNMDDMEDIKVKLISLGEMNDLIRHGLITHGLVLNAMMLYSNYTKG